jgi:hypothetical protein
MRNVTVSVVVGIGVVLLTTAAAAPNADLRDAYSAIARLEARIATLERARAQGQAVRAPFRVVDSDGSTILRVSGGEAPSLEIGSEKTGSVEIGGTRFSGYVRISDLADSTGGGSVHVVAQKGAAQLRVIGRSHSALLTAEAKEQGAALSLFAGDVPSARIRAGVEGHGAVILTDKSGAPMVRAGMLKGGEVGVVWTGPRTRAGSMGPPSLLQGAK